MTVGSERATLFRVKLKLTRRDMLLIIAVLFFLGLALGIYTG